MLKMVRTRNELCFQLLMMVSIEAVFKTLKSIQFVINSFLEKETKNVAKE